MVKVLRIREVGDPILGVKCQEVDLNDRSRFKRYK